MKSDPLVLFYLIDGARLDVMKRLMDEGKLPNISREVVEPGVFRKASSCFTSTTGPAYLPFLLGCFPGTVDIPGIRWLDKKEFAGKRIGKNRLRSYNGIEGPCFNSDLPADRRTLHELFDNSRNIYSMITRSLGAHRDLTKNTKLFRYLTAHLNNKWHRVDAAGQKKLMKCLNDRPDFIFAVFPAVDSFSHIHDPFDDDTIQAYINVDGYIGEAVAKLKEQNRWQNTLLVISSDHGLTSTHTHFDLADFFSDRGLDTLKHPLIFKRRSDVSVMISGNAMGHVYLHDIGPDRPLCGREVYDSMGSLFPELINRKEVDFLAWRESDKIFSVESSRGRALIIRSAGDFTYLPQ
ncbi:MAG: alkaline phosphatase family protein, partial [Candidatus Aegiribacteria sp.]|nr:alkaline phosphatase family protein [Candidatus Aegiribacteria sp.]